MQIPRQQEIDEWKQNSPSSYCLKSVCNWIKLFITFSGSGSPASPRVKGPYLTSIFKSYDAKDGCKRPCRRSRKTKYSVSKTLYSTPIEICLIVLPDTLQSSVLQDPFGPQFFLHAFWVDGFIVAQHRHDSKGRGPKFISNFQFPNA